MTPGRAMDAEVAVKKIVADLRSQIRDSLYARENPDEASWGNECGVLLSVNEAKAIIAALAAGGEG
jgi:hypothetical protein